MQPVHPRRDRGRAHEGPREQEAVDNLQMALVSEKHLRHVVPPTCYREMRNDNWEAAMVWQNLAWDYTIKGIGDKFSHVINGLYLVEGLIIYMVKKMDMKNLRECAKTETFISSLLCKLHKIANIYPLLLPRWVWVTFGNNLSLAPLNSTLTNFKLTITTPKTSFLWNETVDRKQRKI